MKNKSEMFILFFGGLVIGFIISSLLLCSQMKKEQKINVERQNQKMVSFELLKGESYYLGNLLVVDNTNEDRIIIQLNEDIGKR